MKSIERCESTFYIYRMERKILWATHNRSKTLEICLLKMLKRLINMATKETPIRRMIICPGLKLLICRSRGITIHAPEAESRASWITIQFRPRLSNLRIKNWQVKRKKNIIWWRQNHWYRFSRVSTSFWLIV